MWSKYTSACAEFSDALFLRKQQETIVLSECNHLAVDHHHNNYNHSNPVLDDNFSSYHGVGNYTLNTNPVAEGLLFRILEDERLKPASFHTHQRIADIDHFVLHALEKNGVVTNPQHLSASGNLCYIDRETRLPFCLTFPVPANQNFHQNQNFHHQQHSTMKWICKMVVPPLHSELSGNNMNKNNNHHHSSSLSTSYPRAASESNASIFPDINNKSNKSDKNQNFLFSVGLSVKLLKEQKFWQLFIVSKSSKKKQDLFVFKNQSLLQIIDQK